MSIIRRIVFFAPLHNPVEVSTSVPDVKIWPRGVTRSDPVSSDHSHVGITSELLTKNLEAMICVDFMEISL